MNEGVFFQISFSTFSLFDLFTILLVCKWKEKFWFKKKKNSFSSQQTMDRNVRKITDFFSLTGSSRTTLKKTNDMAPMVCLYAIPCPVPCYICFYLYTTNLVHIHIHIHVDINAVWPVIRYNTHTTQKLTHRERRVRVIIFIRRHHRRCDCRRCLHCGCCCLCCYCCCCFLIWYRFFAGCH